MPVDFVTGGQVAAYGRYAEAPSVEQLERLFHFDERDRALIDRRRGDHNRLGLVVQLGTVRFLGTFLARPAEVPEIAARRGFGGDRCRRSGLLGGLREACADAQEHAGEIQREYGYRDFSDSSAQAELLGWLDARAWATSERPSVLFDLATARLTEAKVLLPARACWAERSPRHEIEPRHAFIAHCLMPPQLSSSAVSGSCWRSGRRAALAPGVMRAGPRKLTASEVAEAFQRLAVVRGVVVGGLVADVPAGRLRTLARYRDDGREPPVGAGHVEDVTIELTAA